MMGKEGGTFFILKKPETQTPVADVAAAQCRIIKAFANAFDPPRGPRECQPTE